MRIISSCTTCRTRKKKCVPLPAGVCTLCTNKNLPCNLNRVRPSSSVGTVDNNSLVELRCKGNPSSASHVDSVIDSPDNQEFLESVVCDELVNLYFELFHNTQHIIFHRWSFITARSSGDLPDYILLAVIALMARFSSNVYFESIAPGDRGSPYLRQALKSLNDRAELSSVYALQGCVLLSFACFVEDLLDQSSLLSAQAIRMAQLLRLPRLSQSGDHLQEEIEVRLYWQVYMMDAWDAARDELPRQLVAKSSTPLPLSEAAFENLRPGSLFDSGVDSFSGQRSLGIWSEVAALTDSFVAVVKTIALSVEKPSMVLDVESKVEALTLQLDSWLNKLSPDLHNNSDNFQRFASRGDGRSFAVLHLIHHHQGQLLYFRYLSKCLNDSSETFNRKWFEYAARCKAHAVALSKLMWTTNTTCGMECLWSPVNGHLLVVASSIHLFTLLTDQNHEKTTEVKTLLEKNFVMLVQFQRYWPTLRVSISRLQAFQKACLRHKAAECFEMDPWMEKFLLSYQSMIDERFLSDEDQHIPTLVNFDPDMLWPSIIGEGIEQSHLGSSLSFA